MSEHDGARTACATRERKTAKRSRRNNPQRNGRGQILTTTLGRCLRASYGIAGLSSATSVEDVERGPLSHVPSRTFPLLEYVLAQSYLFEHMSVTIFCECNDSKRLTISKDQDGFKMICASIRSDRHSIGCCGRSVALTTKRKTSSCVVRHRGTICANHGPPEPPPRAIPRPSRPQLRS